MGFLQCRRRWSKDEEVSPDSHPNQSRHLDSFDSNCLSSQPSLASVSSLTSKQPSTTANHYYLTTFKAHTSSISSLTLAGKHLLSGSSDNQIRIWPRDPSPPIQNLIAYGESAVKSMVVCGDKLFTGHQDHKICVWKIDHDDDDDLNNRKMIKSTRVATLPTLNDRVAKLFLAKNYVKIRRHKRCTWVHHVDTVAALALSHDGSLLYSASWDRTFKVWRTSDFKCLESVWNAHDDAINAIVVSHDGYVYTGSADRKIKVWRRHDGEKKHRLVDTLEKHKSAVNALALSTDGSLLYSGACDRSIIVWEKVGGDGGGESGGDGGHMVVAGALRGHGMAILCIAVVGDLVVSGSADKTVRLWRRGIDGKRYSHVGVMEGHNGPIKCLAAAVDSCTSADSSGTSYLVYSGSLDCDVNVWKVWIPFL